MLQVPRWNYGQEQTGEFEKIFFLNFMKNKILDVRRISSQIGAMGTWQGAISPMKNAGGYHDIHNTVHSVSPQLLNEMIDYADENDIKRSRDMVIRKESGFYIFDFRPKFLANNKKVLKVG